MQRPSRLATLQRAAASNAPVALLMLDVDHFKRINGVTRP